MPRLSLYSIEADIKLVLAILNLLSASSIDNATIDAKNNKALVLAEINKGKTLSELLSYLDINQLCVKIISNGERSGNLANDKTPPATRVKICS
jgi:type II secretory pathway component PulF